MDGRSLRAKSTYYFKDLTGKRFGRLVVQKQAGQTKHRNKTWVCKCDCGKTVTVAGGHLTSGHTKSCGCLAMEIRIKSAERHGYTTGGKPRTFIIWNDMKARCLNPKSISYKSYGARGIKVCEEWMEFKNFHEWAISHGYNDNLTIDRIDNNKGYSPENCRWIPARENKIRQRRTRFIQIGTEVNSISGWCKKTGISKTIAYKALHVSEQAFKDMILKKGKTISSISS